MQHSPIRKTIRVTLLVTAIAMLSVSLISFTTRSLTVDFLTQLGISRPDADSKITRTLLGGYLDIYGVRNVKNIALGNRTAVTRDILSYVKEYAASETFKKEYLKLKESNKPQEQHAETPEAMRSGLIASYKKAVSEMETNAKKADPSMKQMFDQLIADTKRQLKDAEDPKNQMISSYTEQYPDMVKSMKENYEHRMTEWEKEYPANPLIFVKQRLESFMQETKDIKFDAELTTSKYGKKVFVNPVYERKSNYWKMAFRAGREVVEPSREFVKQWISEIN